MSSTLDMFKYETRSIRFAAGATVFQEGDVPDLMYVVRAGEVDIVFRSEVLETVRPGGIVGEMALVDSAPRSASAIARSDCDLVPIDTEDFGRHVGSTPFFALRVMRTMARRLRTANERAGHPGSPDLP